MMISLLLASAFASTQVQDQPLLSKTITSGFVRPEMQKSSRCTLYPGYVVIETTSGDLKATTGKNIGISGQLRDKIKEASQGQVTEEPAPTDGPITSYQGTLPDGTTVELKSEGSRKLKNSSAAATTLVNFLDQICS